MQARQGFGLECAGEAACGPARCQAAGRPPPPPMHSPRRRAGPCHHSRGQFACKKGWEKMRKQRRAWGHQHKTQPSMRGARIACRARTCAAAVQRQPGNNAGPGAQRRATLLPACAVLHRVRAAVRVAGPAHGTSTTTAAAAAASIAPVNVGGGTPPGRRAPCELPHTGRHLLLREQHVLYVSGHVLRHLLDHLVHRLLRRGRPWSGSPKLHGTPREDQASAAPMMRGCAFQRSCTAGKHRGTPWAAPA